MLSHGLKEQPIREPNTLLKCLLSATDTQWMLVVHQERSQTGISLDIRPDSSVHVHVWQLP